MKAAVATLFAGLLAGSYMPGGVSGPPARAKSRHRPAGSKLAKACRKKRLGLVGRGY